MAGAPMIEADGLTKRYGDTQALAGVSLQAPAGTILGVLGPNGAGKTTAVRILTTLALPDGGSARVAGHDVVLEAGTVRRFIGVTAQDATLDDALTGRQNLVMVGELSDLRRPEAKRRAAELLERFGLTDAADRVLKGYSGGMRRRLDLAAGLVTRPPVLFLDEPTTGLDPTSRAGMWQIIRELVADGATLLLTTQYLEEADQLADRIVVIDHGRVIAEGTPAQLKADLGATFLDVGLIDPATAALAAEILATVGTKQPTIDGSSIELPVDDGPRAAMEALRLLDARALAPTTFGLREPSLDDVFLALTGKRTEAEDDPDAPPADKTRGRGRGRAPATTPTGGAR